MFLFSNLYSSLVKFIRVIIIYIRPIIWHIIPNSTHIKLIIGDFNTISGGVGLCGFDTVGNYCYLGKYSMVFDNVALADYTLVGAGAHVKNDTQEYDVIVPARSVLLEGRKSTDFKV